MLKIENISQQTREKILPLRYDQIVEKHEGPFDWEYKLGGRELDTNLLKYFPDHDPIAETAQFLEIGSYNVLLPIGRKHHPNITILHHFFGQDLTKLVIYLKDTTYDDDVYGSGYIAVCDLIQPENFYLATLYHEWFIIDYDKDSKLR